MTPTRPKNSWLTLRSLSVCLAVTTLLSINHGCIKKKRQNSSTTAAEVSRKSIQDEWEKGNAWIRKKYTSKIHTEIIDLVFERAFKVLGDPKSLEGMRTQVFVLNSLPGTGKTQFVTDLAIALNIKDTRFHYKLLGKEDRHIDAKPFQDDAEESGDLNSPDHIVKPAIVMYDEYTHAEPLGGIAFADGEEDLNESKRRLESSIVEKSELIATLITVQNSMNRSGPDFNQKYTEMSEQITSLNKLIAVYQTEKSKIETAIQSAQINTVKRTEEEAEAIKNLRLMWSALGEGSFQKEISDSQKAQMQRSLQNLNYALAETRRKVTDIRSDLALTEVAREKVRKSLLVTFEKENAQSLATVLQQRNALLDEARQKYQINFDAQKKAYEEISAQAIANAAAKSAASATGSATGGRSGAYEGEAVFGPDSPPPEARTYALNLPSPPQYDFIEPELPAFPAIPAEEIWLSQQIKYATLTQQVTALQTSLVEWTSSLKRQLLEQKGILSEYLGAYPNANRILEAARNENGTHYFPVADVVRKKHLRDRGLTDLEYEENATVESGIQDLIGDWKNSEPVYQLMAYFAHDPSAFFNLNDSEISKQVNTKTYRTGHIFLFLASNVFQIQNEAEKMFANPNQTFDICNTEKMQKLRGVWPRLKPDRKDPQCHSALVAKLSTTPAAREAMDNALYGLFGANLNEFKKNLPALKSRLGGDPKFIPPPTSQDYGNFVEFELESVRLNVKKAVSSFDEFVLPEILFSKALRAKLYLDRIDAQAGYRVMQNTISSVVFEGVKTQTVMELVYENRAKLAKLHAGNLKKYKPNPTTKLTFDFLPETSQMVVYFNSSKTPKILQDVRFVSQADAEQFLRSARDDFLNQQHAAWLAGEITLTSILFESLPGIDVKFLVDKKGIQERAAQKIPEWALPAGTNWPAEADNILAHFAGAAAEMELTPAMSRLPESDMRIAGSETLARDLHARLRKESGRLANDENRASEFPTRVLGLNDRNQAAFANHPVFKVLSKFNESVELPPEAILELKETALNHMKMMAAEHIKLLSYMALKFVDLVDETNEMKEVSAQDVYNAFIKANDAKAYSDVLTVELLARLNPLAPSNKRGEYDSLLGRSFVRPLSVSLLSDDYDPNAGNEFFEEMPEVVAEAPSQKRASIWDRMKPTSILGHIGQSLVDLSTNLQKKKE